jgi:hypothetical protein
MKYQFATACAALSLAFAGSAFADGQVTATLASPQAAPSKIIAAHSVWNCAAATCVATVAPDDAATLDGCKDLAKKVGPVSAYGAYKPLDEKALAKCNVAAKAPAAAGTASR